MLPRLKHLNLLAALLLILSAVPGRAITFMAVESAYEGDGWFRYTLTFPTDQFTPYARIGNFSPEGFGITNEVSTPDGWTYKPSGNNSSWLAPNPIERPATYVFRAHSPLRHFKKTTVISGLIVKVASNSYYRGFGEISGVAIYDILTPCLPEEADDTANPFTKRLELTEDLKIESVFRENGKIRGFRLNWGFPAVYAVEASTDLSSWRSATEFVADGTFATQYFSAVADPGPFYRLRLVDYYGPQYIDLFSNPKANQPSKKPIKGAYIELGENGPEAVFPSSKGMIYTVEALSIFGEIKNSITVTGDEPTTHVLLPAASVSHSVFIRVLAPSAVAQ